MNALGVRAAAGAGGYDGGPQGDAIGEQLRRIADLGFIPNRMQRGVLDPTTPCGREYREALADMAPVLVRIAVDRWNRTAQEKFFPLPGQLRAMVSSELADAEHVRVDENCRRIRAEMRARYPGSLLLAGD